MINDNICIIAGGFFTLTEEQTTFATMPKSSYYQFAAEDGLSIFFDHKMNDKKF